MECKHENTRKLFWSNNNPSRWERTNVSICLDCNAIVGKQEIKIEENIMKKPLEEENKKVKNEN